MIIEHRMYSFKPGSIDGWLLKYEKDGLPVQKKHLGTFMGLYISEIGVLHTSVLMWAYEDLADRERRRAAMYADPDWQKFISEIWALEAIQKQEVMIMNPASYSPEIK
ncbi:MAG: NIPSNAP family protein [OCS116 cluster bacterium]|nr:NIPSNAP family protein [OCS116 cluster bacterium]